MSDIVISLVVSPILQEALSKVVSFATSIATHIKKSLDLEKQLVELRESLIMMQSLLEVAEGMKKSHDAVRKWLQKVEDEAHNLVDLLDEYAYAVHQQEVGTKNQLKKKVRYIYSLCVTMSRKTEEIKDSLNNIRRDSSLINLLFKHATLCQDPIETTSYSSDNSEVLGRNDDVSKVVSLLSDLSGRNRLSGLSIVGMPGIGKTALARAICKRAEEENLYDLVAWVCLSENFDEKMILRGLLGYLGSSGGSMVNTGAILKRLKSMLENKKFLLVLDDVWNEVPRSWKTLFSYLLQILKTTGNSIVVTTSSKQVVASTCVMAAVPMHEYELQKLSVEECQLIMEKILRSYRITTRPMDLLDIAKQCGGLPLVATVIGETLSHHTDADEWLAIKNNTAWNSAHRMEIVSELKKSFDRLPSRLKKCFSYCSIFPKGFEIRRDNLVQLWLARGFLRQSDDSKSDKEEDVGDKYLNDLVSNYLFQDVKMDKYGNIKSCKMHDEVHNLALFVSKYETCTWPGSFSIEESSSIRHMTVISDADLQALPRSVAPKLRSLFLEVDVFHTMALHLKSLQALKLAAADRKELQECLGNLKCHMKYLDISDSEIEGLPEFVTKLYNLQTLRFMGCRLLMDLPSDIGKLVSLRHIHFNDERHMPCGLGKLTSLQTLPLFVVSAKEGQRIVELKRLSQLRGKLKICNLEQVHELEAAEAKLEEKVKLLKLQFLWSGNRAISNSDEVVLERLRPHSNLKSLTIENYKGVNFPSWMVKDVSSSASSFRLNSLVKLKLIDCDECGDILCLGLLPKLKVLNITAMSKVERIGRTFYYNRSNIASSSQGVGQSITTFPALRKLMLSNMTKLEKWTAEDTEVFPSLEDLHIEGCPEFKTWWIDGSASPKLSKLSIHSCPKLVAIPRRLLNLISLNINDCPKLMGYAEEQSLKWCTICHIHSIRINGRVVRSQR